MSGGDVGEFHWSAVQVGQLDVDHLDLLRGDAFEIQFGAVAGDFERLEGEVIEVLRAGTFGVEVVVAGGHGSEGARVVLVVEVKEEEAVDLLKEGEVGGGGHGSVVDVFQCDGLVFLGGVGNAVLVGRVGEGAGAVLIAGAADLLPGVELCEGDLLDGAAVVGALHGVGGGETLSVGGEGERLGGVDGEVDPLVLQAEAVEVGVLRARAFEAELARGIELDGVEEGDGRESDVFEINGLIRGAGHDAGNGELGRAFSAAGEEAYQCAEDE